MKQKVMNIDTDLVIPTNNMNLNKLDIKRTTWNAKASIVAKNTFNPIRNILDFLIS